MSTQRENERLREQLKVSQAKTLENERAWEALESQRRFEVERLQHVVSQYCILAFLWSHVSLFVIPMVELVITWWWREVGCACCAQRVPGGTWHVATVVEVVDRQLDGGRQDWAALYAPPNSTRSVQPEFDIRLAHFFKRSLATLAFLG